MHLLHIAIQLMRNFPERKPFHPVNRAQRINNRDSKHLTLPFALNSSIHKFRTRDTADITHWYDETVDHVHVNFDPRYSHGQERLHTPVDITTELPTDVRLETDGYEDSRSSTLRSASNKCRADDTVRCHDGSRYICSVQQCDGVPDCDDGGDEVDCPHPGTGGI